MIKRSNVIKLIIVADNPGKDELANGKYLVGAAGKQSASFFAKHGACIGISNYNEQIIILNKTPIFTKSTKCLESIMLQAVEETQRWMAQKIAELHQALKCSLWIVGYDNLDDIFRTFKTEFIINYLIVSPVKSKEWSLVKVYKHFSRNWFLKDLTSKKIVSTAFDTKKFDILGKCYRRKHIFK